MPVILVHVLSSACQQLVICDIESSVNPVVHLFQTAPSSSRFFGQWSNKAAVVLEWRLNLTVILDCGFQEELNGLLVTQGTFQMMWQDCNKH